MLVVISPAKKLDFETQVDKSLRHSKPQLLKSSEELIAIARELSPRQLAKLMKISDKLVQLNRQRYQDFSTPFTPKNAKQAVLAFSGDTYIGLDAKTLTGDAHVYAQEHLRILSGLYGLLRPLDLIQPYRLEMGISLQSRRGKNLYEFWGEQITTALNKAVDKSGTPFLLNCASQEYIKVVKPDLLKADMITPVFKQVKNGEARMLGMMAKRARGAMARFVIEHRIEQAEDLQAFNLDGYRFQAKLSDSRVYEFHRSA